MIWAVPSRGRPVSPSGRPLPIGGDVSRILHLTLAGILAVAVVLAGPGRPAEAFVPLAIPIVITGKSLLVAAGVLTAGGLSSYWLYSRQGDDNDASADPAFQSIAPDLLLQPEHLGLLQDGTGASPPPEYDYPYWVPGPGADGNLAGISVTYGTPYGTMSASGDWSYAWLPVSVKFHESTVDATRWFFFEGVYIQLNGQWEKCGAGVNSAFEVNLVAGQTTSYSEVIRCERRYQAGAAVVSPDIGFVPEVWAGLGSSVYGQNPWFYSGHEQVIPEPEWTPIQRFTRTELECYDPVTNSVSTVVVESTAYWTTPDTTTPVPAPTALCPEGTAPKKLTITSEPADGFEGASVPLINWEQDESLLTQAAPMIDCLVSPQLCVLRVVRITANGTEEECDPSLGNCEDWLRDQQRAQRYRCYWGPHRLALLDCIELERTYNTGTQGQITPSIQTQTQQQATATPTNPSTGTGLVTYPNTSYPGVPQPPPVTFPDPTPNPVHGDTSCWENLEVGWNPTSWVLEPVKCALIWAFVPSAATWAAFSATADVWAAKPPFSFFSAGAQWFAPLANTGGSCLLLSGEVVGHQLTVVDSCTPGAVESHIMSWRPWLLIVVHAWFMVPLLWWAWKAYAPGSQGVA